MKSRITLHILNTSFTVTSDQEEPYFRRVVECYSNLVSQVEKSLNISDPLKIAIVAGLLAVDCDSAALTQPASDNPVPEKTDPEAEAAVRKRLTAILEKLDTL